jgi:uncharacterized protein (TIGR03083 family)
MSSDLNYLDAIGVDGRRLAGFAEQDTSVRVPSCPDYDVEGLLTHVGWVYAFVTAQLRSTDPASPAPIGPEGTRSDEEPLGEWFNARFDALTEALGEVGTDVAMWSFGKDQSSGFYHRRMAHESAIHRWDGDHALNPESAAPIDRLMAIDGVDEIAEVSLAGGLGRDGAVAPAGSMHLHATDGDGEWSFELIDGEISMTHEHTKGDAAVRGTASDLFLFIWGRGREDCELFGDESVADQWAALSP